MTARPGMKGDVSTRPDDERSKGGDVVVRVSFH